MARWTWAPWGLDVNTWGWIIIMIEFLVWEFIGVVSSARGDTLTEHLRPVFNNYSLLRFLAVGFWLWLGYHFFIERV